MLVHDVVTDVPASSGTITARVRYHQAFSGKIRGLFYKVEKHLEELAHEGKIGISRKRPQINPLAPLSEFTESEEDLITYFRFNSV